ncbi:MAG TPA: chalcone isomerase family protein [Thermoanaerobaculia bacterium]|nr:chalcone isomerase family protein [Thermoanaerobaculia bacterium]
MRILTSALLSLALLSLLLVVPAGAASLAGVNLPDKTDVKEQSLVLNGIALRTKYLIKVYVAGLYLPQKEKSAAKILAADSTRQQVMHFLYGVSKAQMCDAWNDGLALNTPNASAEVKKAFTTLCSWMEAIPKGNKLVLTYLPGEGTQVQVNGEQKGMLRGKATADAILSTWIGPKPDPGQDFKKALLGQ